VSRFDVFRSFVREATAKVRDRAVAAIPLEQLKELASDLRYRRVRIPESALTRAVAHASMVEEASVRARDGSLDVDARFRGGREPFVAIVRPEVRAFAPRGAKELSFHLEPAEAATHPLAADVLSCLAGVIAYHLWAASGIPVDSDPSGAFVERDVGASFRVDLRTVPAVRAIMDGQASQLIVEALVPREIAAIDGSLKIELALPTFFGP
jgi:hypothetical protein